MGPWGQWGIGNNGAMGIWGRGANGAVGPMGVSPEVGFGELLHVELLVCERRQMDVPDGGEHIAYGGHSAHRSAPPAMGQHPPLWGTAHIGQHPPLWGTAHIGQHPPLWVSTPHYGARLI